MAITPIDKYLADVPDNHRLALEKLRVTILKNVPKGTEETIGYGIPIFKWNGALIGFASFKKHWILFSCSGSALKKMKDDFKDFKGTVSAVHFTPEKPIPVTLVKKLIRVRIEETKAKLEKKAKKAKQ